MIAAPPPRRPKMSALMALFVKPPTADHEGPSSAPTTGVRGSATPAELSSLTSRVHQLERTTNRHGRILLLLAIALFVVALAMFTRPAYGAVGEDDPGRFDEAEIPAYPALPDDDADAADTPSPLSARVRLLQQIRPEATGTDRGVSVDPHVTTIEIDARLSEVAILGVRTGLTSDSMTNGGNVGGFGGASLLWAPDDHWRLGGRAFGWAWTGAAWTAEGSSYELAARLAVGGTGASAWGEAWFEAGWSGRQPYVDFGFDATFRFHRGESGEARGGLSIWMTSREEGVVLDCWFAVAHFGEGGEGSLRIGMTMPGGPGSAYVPLSWGRGFPAGTTPAETTVYVALTLGGE